MKYLVASDVHGSALYCGQLLKAYARERADELILLGDILYHGPRNDLPEGYAPKQVIAMLNPLADQITCVRGNCDAEVDQMVLAFPLMDTWKLRELCGHRCFLTHGHHYGPEQFPADSQRQGADCLFFGHTHVPGRWVCGDLVCMNPGSVSIPKNGSGHGYLILEPGLVTWKLLDGTVTDQCVW